MPKGPHHEFARRLNLAWDLAGFQRGRRRVGHVSAEYSVSRETARKWSGGLAIPKDERLRAIAVQTRVKYEWLTTGRGPMMIEDQGIGEQATKYDSPEEVRLVGLVRKLTRRKQRALIELLEEQA